jgi:tetratricopeptide (TPR) repeat protein
MTMDGRVSLSCVAFAFLLGCAGCVTTQNQKTVAVDTGNGKLEEVSITKTTNGPKTTPPVRVEIAFGKLKEVEADSDTNKHNPELQRRLRDEARKAYQKALEIDKNNLEATRCLARLYLKINDYERALDVYKKALAKNPKEAVLWYDLGNAHKRKHDFPESLRCFNKALEIDPENRDFIKAVGFMLAWMGQTDQGLAYLSRVQGQAMAHCNIARVLIERNQIAQARQQVALARQLNPELPEALALQQWLDNGSQSAAAR